MSKENIIKHIRFSQSHIDILDALIENKIGINSYAEAVRYAVDCLGGSTKDLSKDTLNKLNIVAKTIDILVEMTAGGFDFLDVKSIGKSATDTYIYADAKKNTENNIQRSTTIKANTITTTNKSTVNKNRNFY